jgi:Mn-dependent DtxR family transcriptional regulator
VGGSAFKKPFYQGPMASTAKTSVSIENEEADLSRTAMVKRILMEMSKDHMKIILNNHHKRAKSFKHDLSNTVVERADKIYKNKEVHLPIADREASYLEQHYQYVPKSQEITKKVLSEKDTLLEKHVEDCENNKNTVRLR